MKDNKKNIVKIIVAILLIICSFLSIYKIQMNPTSDEKDFKNTYESLNGKTSSYGKNYRTVSIPEKNHIKLSTISEINKMVDNKETFYVYFGFESCPWCRSVIETMLASASENNIEKIYYVDVRPGEDSEKTDIRDEYALDQAGNVYLQRKGTRDYHDFLKKFDSVLNDYSHGDVKTLDNTKYEGAKRLGAPNFIYVKKGVPKKLISGISEDQTDGYMELSKKMLNDERKAFDNFFK